MESMEEFEQKRRKRGLAVRILIALVVLAIIALLIIAAGSGAP